jgi:hypothetical protein
MIGTLVTLNDIGEKNKIKNPQVLKIEITKNKLIF